MSVPKMVGAGAFSVGPGVPCPTTVDVVGGAERLGAGVPGAGDAFGQHGLAGAGGYGASDGGSQFVACLAGRGEQQAGGGAELAGAAGDGGDVLLGECVNLFGGAVQGAGEDEDRVERGHFRVDRDGLGACRRGAHQGDPGGLGAGEAHGLDGRVRHEGLADAGAGAVDQGEDARVQTQVLDGLDHGLADEFARAGVGVVGLEDHRAAGGEGGGGVSSRRREGQREVAGAEHGHRSQRDLALADVGAGERRALRQGGVDADAAEVALPDHGGEQAELAGGAGTFALQPGRGQSGLLARADDQLVADGFDVVRDGFQEAGVRFGVEGAEGRVRLGGRGGGCLELLFGEQGVGGFQLFVAGGVEAKGGLAFACDGLPCDQGMSGECHCGYS